MILETVNKEFNEQGAFARRWAPRDFQKKAGLSIKDWPRSATDIATKLRSLDNLLDAEDVREAQQFQGQLLSLKPLLGSLAKLEK